MFSNKVKITFTVFLLFLSVFLTLSSCKSQFELLKNTISIDDEKELKRLLSKKVNLKNMKDSNQLLLLAIKNKNYNIAEILVDNDVNTNNIFIKDYPAHFELAFNGKEKLLSKMIDKGLDVSCVDSEGDNLLQVAIICNSIELLDKLITNNIDINHKNHDSRTPLSLAIFRRDAVKAKFLIEHGADVNYSGPDGIKILTELAYYFIDGNIEIAEIVLAKNASIISSDTFALHAAVLEGNIDFTKWLLMNKADPNIADNKGILPIEDVFRFTNNPQEADDPIKVQRAYDIRNLLIEYGSKDTDTERYWLIKK